MSYRVINGKLIPIENISPAYTQKNNSSSNEVKNGRSFEEILKNQLNIKKEDTFTISNHAADRLSNVSFNQYDMKMINEGINKAKEKGSKNSLILYKDVALITSIENRTIITAVDKNRSSDNVFTNIDSVVLL